MTHEDAGHYAAKHQGRAIDPETAARLEAQSHDNNITCAAAHRLAGELSVAPSEIGVQADLMELRIMECQLGLFGYESGEKRIDPSIAVPDDLWAELEACSDDGRISCSKCWEIAKKFKKSRLDLASACEKIGIRIKPCQLGAF